MTATKETPKKDWRARFLAALERHGNVTLSAKAAGITRSWAYRQRDADPVFAAEWVQAIDRGVDALEDEAKRRALKDSDTLLIFLLKSHRPEKYRDVSKVNHDGGLTIKVVYADPDVSD